MAISRSIQRRRGLVLRELLDEVRPRHAALVDDEVLDLALDLADVVDLAAHAVAKPLDLARGKADLHQLGRDLLLQLEVLRRLVAFLLQHAQHPRVQAADHAEAGQRGDLQTLEILGGDRAAVVLGFLAFLDVFVVHRLELLVEIHQAVDDVVDLELVLFDLGGEVEDLRDRHRAGRDRHDHVLQALFDPLGDLDLAFAGQELDRAHFAHVHAHRVGRAAEFRVERRCRGFGGFLVDVVGGSGRRRFGHQQLFGVGGLVVDLDPHVVDHGDDAFDLLGVEDVVGQMVVDLGVGQVASLLAEHDQILQPRLARLGLGRGQLDLARLDAAVLAAADLAFGQRLFGAPCRQARGDFAGGRLDRRLGSGLARGRAVASRDHRLLARRLAVQSSPALSTASTRARPAPWAPAWPACFCRRSLPQAWPTGLWPSAPGVRLAGFFPARDRLFRRAFPGRGRAGAPKLPRRGLPGRLGTGLGLAARLRRPGRFGLGLDARFPDGLRMFFGHDRPTSCGADL